MRVRGPPLLQGVQKERSRVPPWKVKKKGEAESYVRFHDMLIQIVRKAGTDEELTFVSIAEQMQIVQSMGIEVEEENKAEDFAAELTKELGLNSWGAEEEDVGEDEATRIVDGGMPNFNLDPNIFQHDNLAY